MVISDQQIPLIENQLKTNLLPGYQYLKISAGFFNGMPSYYINFEQSLMAFGIPKTTTSSIVIINEDHENQLLIIEHGNFNQIMTTFDYLQMARSTNDGQLTINEFKSIMDKATFNSNYMVNDRTGRIMVLVSKDIDSVTWGINQLLSLRSIASAAILK